MVAVRPPGLPLIVTVAARGRAVVGPAMHRASRTHARTSSHAGQQQTAAAWRQHRKHPRPFAGTRSAPEAKRSYNLQHRGVPPAHELHSTRTPGRPKRPRRSGSLADSTQHAQQQQQPAHTPAHIPARRSMVILIMIAVLATRRRAAAALGTARRRRRAVALPVVPAPLALVACASAFGQDSVNLALARRGSALSAPAAEPGLAHADACRDLPAARCSARAPQLRRPRCAALNSLPSVRLQPPAPTPLLLLPSCQARTWPVTVVPILLRAAVPVPVRPPPLPVIVLWRRPPIALTLVAALIVPPPLSVAIAAVLAAPALAAAVALAVLGRPCAHAAQAPLASAAWAGKGASAARHAAA